MMDRKFILCLILLFCLKVNAQNEGVVDYTIKFNGTQRQAMSFELVGDALHVKGSMLVCATDLEQLTYRIHSDTIYLNMIYKSGVSDDLVKGADVEFNMPGCTQDVYDVILQGGGDGTLSTKVDRRSVSITYETGEKNRDQDLSYGLSDDTLNIKGYLYGNCCGVHTLMYRKDIDNIYLERFEGGELCDCEEAHWVDISLPDCTSDSYHIHLAAYGEHVPGTAEDVTVSASSVVEAVNDSDCRILYDKGSCMIELPESCSGVHWELNVFDTSGRKIFADQGIHAKIRIPVNKLVSGEFICRVECGDKLFTKKIIIQ